MTKGTNLWKKGLALLLAAACAVTVSPARAFAEEAEEFVFDDAVLLETFAEEGDEADAAADEAVLPDDAEAGTDAEAEAEEPEALAEGENEVTTFAGSCLTEPTLFTIGDEVHGTVTPKRDWEEGKTDQKIDRIYFDRIYYRFTVEEPGIYQFDLKDYTAKTQFSMACDMDHWTTTSYKHTHMREWGTTTVDFEKGKELALHKGEYLLEAFVDKNYAHDTDTFTFQLSKKDAPLIALDEKAPTAIQFNETYTQQLYDMTGCGSDGNVYHQNFYQLTVEEPGTLTLLFKDDSRKENGCSMNVAHAGNSADGKFEWQLATNKFENYSSTGMTWIDQETVRLSLPQPGVYNFVVKAGYSYPKYTFRVSDWTPLKDEDEFKAINDSKLGGSNDWPFKGDTDWGNYYNEKVNGPMPEVEVGKKYRSIITEDSKKDYFTFKLEKEGPLYLSLASTGDIGKLKFELKYYYPGKDNPSTGEKDGSTEDASLKEYPVATAPTPVNDFQLQHSVNKGGRWDYTTSFPAGEYIIYFHSDRLYERVDGKDFRCGDTGIYSFLISTKAGEGGFGKACPTVVTKQKVDLLSAEYFNITINPKDKSVKHKFVIKKKNDKKYGAVTAKGLFTAKKDTNGAYISVTHQKRVKVGKKWGKFEDAETVTFKIETPVIHYEKNPATGREVKTFNRIRKGDVLSTADIVTCSVESREYQISDKKQKNFEMDEAGNVTVKNSGNCRVTVFYYYGDNAKYAAKYTYTIKATLPTMKPSLTMNKTKNTAKPSNKMITVTKVDKELARKLSADSWSIREASYDSSTKQYALLDGESTLLTKEFVANGKGEVNYSKCKVLAGTEAGIAAVVVNIDDVEYCTFVTIK